MDYRFSAGKTASQSGSPFYRLITYRKAGPGIAAMQQQKPFTNPAINIFTKTLTHYYHAG